MRILGGTFVERPFKETLTIEFKSDRKCYPMSKLY